MNPTSTPISFVPSLTWTPPTMSTTVTPRAGSSAMAPVNANETALVRSCAARSTSLSSAKRALWRASWRNERTSLMAESVSCT